MVAHSVCISALVHYCSALAHGVNQLPVVRPTNILFFIFIFTQYGVRSGAYSRSMASGCWLTGVQQLSYSSQSMAPLAGGSASGGEVGVAGERKWGWTGWNCLALVQRGRWPTVVLLLMQGCSG